MEITIKNLKLHELVNLAECATPDNETSAGAKFLFHVRDAFIEAIEYDGECDDRSIHEIADSAPDVYTHRRWKEFVDLGAYREDISDLVSAETSMDDRAGVALYQIAERLVSALVEDFENEKVMA